MPRLNRRAKKRRHAPEKGIAQVSHDSESAQNSLQQTPESAAAYPTGMSYESLLFDQKLPVSQRRTMAQQIAQQHGNRHLQRLIENNPQNDIQRLGSSGLGEAIVGAIFDEEMPVEEILTSNDSSNVNPTTLPAIKSAALEDRQKCIALKLREQWWLTQRDILILKEIWRTFSDVEMEASFELWKQTAKFTGMYGNWYYDLPFFEKMADAFKDDTQSLATGRIDRNLHETMIKQMDLGVFTVGDEESHFGTPEKEDENLLEMQEDAQVLSDALLARTMLENIQVGWRPTTYNEMNINQLDQGLDYVGDTLDYALGETTEMPKFEKPPEYMPVRFNEGKPPIAPLGEETPPLPTYEEVQENYLNVLTIIEGLNLKNPGLFALTNDDKLGDFGKTNDPAEARKIIKTTLDELIMNMIRARRTIDTNDLDYRELKPLHAQMRRGDIEAESGVNWTSPFNQWIINTEVEDYEDAEFWKSIGLGTLAAAGFLLAEFATAGTATFWLGAAAGLGASGYQAYDSIEHYVDVATVHSAALSEGTALVSEGQVSAALLSAILDTVFFFIDVVNPAARFMRAKSFDNLLNAESLDDVRKFFGPADNVMEVMTVNRGVQKTGAEIAGGIEQDLKMLQHGDPSSAATVQQGVQEFGVGKTAELAYGWTNVAPHERAKLLLAHVDPSSPAAKRIMEYMQSLPMTPADIQLHLRNLPHFDAMVSGGSLTAKDADTILLALIEEVGPLEVIKQAGGWKKLNNPRVLNSESRAGQVLDEWRRSVVSEVDDYMQANFKGSIKDTGTKKNTSDLDTSQLGVGGTGLQAAAHREAAVSYISGRMGVKPQELAKLLDTDLFTDPRINHLYDQVFKDMPDVKNQIAEQAAAFEQELIQNFRLFEARQSGNHALASQIQEQMQTLSIREMKYRPINPENIAYLNRDIDYLMDKLTNVGQRVDLDEAGKLVQQKEIATEIAQKQALINAAEKGGYFSGGGVRQLVSEREAFPGYSPFIDPKTREVLGESADNAMSQGSILAGGLDQLAKLDPAATKLMKELDPVSGKLLGEIENIEKFSKVLKSIGKYGERFMDFVRRAKLSGYSDELVDAFRGQFNEILKLSGKASTQSELETLSQLAREALGELDKMHMDILKKMKAQTGGFAIQSIDEIAAISRARARLLQAKDHFAYLLALAIQGTSADEVLKSGYDSDSPNEDE